MRGLKLTPEKITSPFQLMAAWFLMLIFLVSILLTAAIKISHPDWAAGYIVVFTSILILIVLCCVTLMLTVFRPNLQDGKEYAQWLKDKNMYSLGLVKSSSLISKSKNRKNLADKFTKTEKTLRPEVNITNAPGATKLISHFKKEGYNAKIYDEPYSGDDKYNSLDEHEAIWVGSAIPPAEAIRTIKIGISEWPHLRYLHLSDDGVAPPEEVNFEMYFGGATSTAKGYELIPWNNEELLDLDENLDRKEFHSIIRSKYP